MASTKCVWSSALLIALAGCSSPSAAISPSGPRDDAGPAESGAGDADDGADGGSPSVPPDAAAGSDAPAPPSDGGTDGPAADAGPSRQSLVWVWQGYSSALQAVAANAASFTQVSPALYQVNYAYASGAAQLVAADDNFDGLTSAQVSQAVHAAGLKCVPLVYGGAGNFGTDQGIQNILDDSPAGAQQSFITSMIAEAKTKGYDGYNLDWEVQNTGYAAYGKKLVSFLSAFTASLHASGMTLSIDLGTWYVRQCTGAGSDGLVDLTTLGASVDWAIIEDYAGALGGPAQGCPAMNGASIDCDSNFVDGLDLMCNLPPSIASIGLISTGSNPFAGDALAAVQTYGFTNVAVWPDDAQFMNGANISPAGATWYSLLAAFLAK
jgi:hypothetical protein